MMVPNGLTCKNTFFDIPEDDADLPEGPATCPPASDGWWPSSSSSRLGSDGPSWPSSPAFFDLPTLGETDQTVLNTPDPWMDSLVHRFGEPLAPNNGSYGATPSPPLMTPDWFERMPMKTSERFPFDPVVGKMTASTPDGRSSSGRSPPSENNSTIARQTPDPFEDTPSPVEASYGRSPSRFDQLLAAEVGRSGDASERSPQRQGSDLSDSLGLPWGTLPKPMLLATAPNGPPATGMPLAPIGPIAPMVPPMGFIPPYPLAPDGGYGFWPFPQGYDTLNPKVHESRKKGGQPRPSPKAPLPAGLLLPGQVSKPGGADEDSPCKSRRKRGGRECKEPEISGDDRYGLLPSAAFIDLGLLERLKP